MERTFLEVSRLGCRRLFWWVAWVFARVPAGAIAGIGYMEFNWGGPPYDGGFLAPGQIPF